MNPFSPDRFFDLSNFKHAALFDKCVFVWEALSRIAPYLKDHAGVIEVTVPKEAHLVNRESISIGKGTVVEPGAYICGPCIIGENCQVRHGAYIRGNFICGDRCVIGHDTEIKNAIFINDTHAAHFAYVGDSILGNRVNLGAGTKCANLRLDNGQIKVHLDGTVYPTGLRKLGAIFGDDAQTGCNSVTNPGTFFGKKATCYPCVNFGGVLAAEHLAKSAAAITIQKQGESA